MSPAQPALTGETHQPTEKANSMTPVAGLEEGMAALLSEAPAKRPNMSVADVIAEMMGETKFSEAKDVNSMVMLAIGPHIKDADDPDWYT